MSIQGILWAISLLAVVIMTVATVALFVYEKPKAGFAIGAVAVLLLVVSLVFVPTIGSIPSGSRGIIYRWGKITDVMLQEGIYHVAPISEHVVIVSIMEQSQTFGEKIRISAQSKDGQEEFLQITVNFQLQADQIQRTYRTIGAAWKDIVLQSPIQEAIRIVATHYEALEAAGKRLEMGQEAQKILQARLDAKNAGVNITIVTVDNVGFSAAFNATLDNLAKLNMDKKAEEIKVATVKAQGEQKITTANAEAESLRLKAKGEADAKISAATAEATANTLLGKSLTANVIAWQQMKIQEVMANKWQGNVPQTMLSGNGVLPIFNVNP